MILVDFAGLVVGMVAQHHEAVGEDMIRHIILNQLRMYSKKFKGEYGQMVICCEGRSWRKDYFPQYKAHRQKNRDASKLDWQEAFRIIDMVLEEIKENVPYKVLRHPQAEADDIIGVLAEYTQQFGRHDEILILSADHDFKQLQRYSNVKQFSAQQKKFVVEKNPLGYLLEHVIKGDSGDGVPNILSGDNVFVEGGRQTVMSAKRYERLADPDQRNLEEERNFIRNETLVDLTKIPENIKEEIIDMYETTEAAPRSKLLNYLIKKRCKMLIDSVGEF